MKSTIEILYEKGLFEIYDNADELLKVYLPIERPKSNSRKLNHDDVVP